MMTTDGTKPGHSLGDVRIFLSAGGEPSETVDALLQAHGVDSTAPLAQIVPIDLSWRVFSDNAALVKDEMHAVFEERLRPGATSLMIARMLLGKTLFGAFEAYSEACSVMSPSLTVTVRRRSSGVSVRWRTTEPGVEVHQILLEGAVAVFFAIFSWMAGQTPEVLRVRAPASRRDSPSTLLQILEAPILFSGDDFEVLFATEAAEIPLQAVNVADWRDGVYRELVRMTLRHTAKRTGGAFTDKVRAALLSGADQQAVASRWGVSPKTVARRLGQEGGSFRHIRDKLRMERSASLMSAGLTVEAIGEAVGYEDARSFRRAFRRWFGLSPSAYRLVHAAN
jgi:AraC-like DNA-binding protein